MKMKTYLTPTCSVMNPQQMGPMMGPMRGPEGVCEWVLRGWGIGERMDEVGWMDEEGKGGYAYLANTQPWRRIARAR